MYSLRMRDNSPTAWPIGAIASTLWLKVSLLTFVFVESIV